MPKLKEDKIDRWILKVQLISDILIGVAAGWYLATQLGLL